MSINLKPTWFMALGAVFLAQTASAQPSVDKEILRKAPVAAQINRSMTVDRAQAINRAANIQKYPLAIIADPVPSPALSPELVLSQIDLAQHALKVRTLGEYRAALRRAIAELHLAIDADVWPFALDLLAYDAAGETQTIELERREDAMLLLAKLEADLIAASDMAGLAEIDLQNAMQKQQQAMQMVSSIMKAQQDTMKATIRNLK